MKEKWLPIKELSNYEVSDNGRIRNIKTGRIIRPQQNDRGYMLVHLRDNNKQITKRVHRLVADAFYDGGNQSLDVNHLDGDKTNNHLSNLEFCTRQENIAHAFRNGLKRPSRMIKIRVVETGEIFESIRECARSLNCDQSAICQTLSGKMRSCNGYHFEKIN